MLMCQALHYSSGGMQTNTINHEAIKSPVQNELIYQIRESRSTHSNTWVMSHNKHQIKNRCIPETTSAVISYYLTHKLVQWPYASNYDALGTPSQVELCWGGRGGWSAKQTAAHVWNLIFELALQLHCLSYVLILTQIKYNTDSKEDFSGSELFSHEPVESVLWFNESTFQCCVSSGLNLRFFGWL